MRQRYQYDFTGYKCDHSEEWNLTLQEAVRQFDRRVGNGPDAQPDRPRGTHTLWLVMRGGNILLTTAES